MKSLMRLMLCIAAGSLAVYAQSAISARSGLIHYIEGKVLVNGQVADDKIGQFPQLKANQELKTEEGRAEVLLTPGVFLRVGENSSVRMVADRLVDTRLEFLSGTAIVEVDDMLKDNAVSIVVKDATVHLLKKGLYRFDSEPMQLRVYDGSANIERGGNTTEVHDGKLVRFDGELAIEKFDKQTGDALNRWSRRRAEYLAMANVSAANSLRNSGTTLYSSVWAWNPYFGMYTFIPMRGRYYSPYGFMFWSPYEVYRVYQRPVYYGNNGGWGGYNASGSYSRMPQTSSGYSGVMASAPASSGSVSTSAASAPAASVSHGSAPAASSSGGGGGRRQ